MFDVCGTMDKKQLSLHYLLTLNRIKGVYEL